MVGECETGRFVKVRGHPPSLGGEVGVAKVRGHLSSSVERDLRVLVVVRGGRGGGGEGCGLVGTAAVACGVSSGALYHREPAP